MMETDISTLGQAIDAFDALIERVRRAAHA